MNKYEITVLDEKGDVVFTAGEFGNDRYEALTALVNYPHWTAGQKRRLHHVEIRDWPCAR